jgi:1,4-alpha-glucan branching enzyme
MGGEIGQHREWNHDGQLEWDLLKTPGHAGLQRLVGDLNRLYAAEPALHQGDCASWGFEWVIGDAAAISAFAYLRRASHGEPVLVLLNMTPVVREDFRVGVDQPGFWAELINSDAAVYGGGGVGNLGGVEAEQVPAHGKDWSLRLTLPPLAALVLKRRDR